MLARVWSTRTGEKLAEFRHDEEIEWMALSSDGRRLATVQRSFGWEKKPVQVWDVAAGRKLFRLDPEKGITAVTFSADDAWIVTGGGDNTARLWDAASGRELARFTHDASVKHVDLSDDKTYLAVTLEFGSNAEKSVAVWDVA